MSLSKKSLTEINQKLQLALQALHEHNQKLQEENALLKMALSSMELQWTQQNERYQKLTNYIQKLRDWLEKNAKTCPIENGDNDE
jgi:hypothetical protein